jgi:hypothetical protein
MRQLCSPSRQHPRPPRLHRIRTLAAATGRQTCPAPVTSETASVVHKNGCGECPWHLSGDDIHPSGCGLECSAQCPVPSAGTPKYEGAAMDAMPWACYLEIVRNNFEILRIGDRDQRNDSRPERELHTPSNPSLGKGGPWGSAWFARSCTARRVQRGACLLSMAWTDGKARGLRRRASSSPYTHSESEGARGAP